MPVRSPMSCPPLADCLVLAGPPNMPDDGCKNGGEGGTCIQFAIVVCRRLHTQTIAELSLVNPQVGQPCIATLWWHGGGDEGGSGSGWEE